MTILDTDRAPRPKPVEAPTNPGSGRRSRRVMWAALAVAMIGLPFLSLPGQYVNDTRDALWLSPNAYMSHALQLWRNSPLLGFEQHDGIAFPMGAVIWLFHALGLPPWVTERIWHGGLLFAAAAFTILLIDHLRGRKTVLAPLLGGCVYALSPFAFGYGLPFSGTFLAYVVLPLLVLIVLIGCEGPILLWSVLFGLASFLMGGGNGAPQVYAWITCVAVMAWIAFVDRRVPVRRVLLFGTSAFAFAIGMNAYWLFLLGSGEIGNALSYSEVPRVINVDSSSAESIRGLGFWLFYGADRAGPWVPTVRPYIASPLLILSGFAVPVAALASAWRSRWRFRLLFASLALLGVFVVSGIFPVTAPAPFGRLLLWSYQHIPGVGGLRTTYKFAATLQLSLAVLIAMGVDPALDAMRRVRWHRTAAAIAIAAAFAVVMANAFPLWTGSLYGRHTGMRAVPAYWQRALADLAAATGTTRAFFAPATTKAYHHWGYIKEGIVATVPDLQSVSPIRLPVGDRYGSNLLAAAEQPYFSGVGLAGSADVFRYLGVSRVVLQNDLDWRAGLTAQPAALHLLTLAPGLKLASSYGRPGQDVASSEHPKDRIERLEASLPPVQVLRVAGALPMVRGMGDPPVILSGDGYGLSSAAGAGLLGRDPPVLYSGSLTDAQIEEMLRLRASVVITDTNRRRVWSFTTPRPQGSATLPGGRTIGGKQTGYGLFGGRPGTQSVAVYPGLSAIEASTDRVGLGSAAPAQPSLAFDGDPNTWWVASEAANSRGAWVEATLARPRALSSISIALPQAADATPIRRVTLDLGAGAPITSDLRPGASTRISFRSRMVRSFRVTIDDLGSAADTAPPPAIADIAIPGLHPAELVEVPTDLLDAVRTADGGYAALQTVPITYLFDRARTGSPLDRDEETGIARRFDVPLPTTFHLQGTVHLNRAALDSAIDLLAFGHQPVTVTSSSRRGGDPRFRGSSAFDGNGLSEWMPEGNVGQSLKISFPPHRVGSVSIATDVGPGRTRILRMQGLLSDGTSIRGDLVTRDGTISMRFPARRISSIKLVVASVFSPARTPSLPIAVREVRIGGIAPLGVSREEPLPCEDTGMSSIDGTPLSLRIDGTASELLVGKELGLSTCDGSPVALGAGFHDLRVGGALQPDTITMANTRAAAAPEASGSADPKINWTSDADGRLDVHVTAATRPFFLAIGQNYSTRWRATIGGSDIGSPIVVDGYSAGWYVTRSGTYTMAIRYGPQRGYTLALLTTALVLGGSCVLLGAVAIRRRGRGRST